LSCDEAFINNDKKSKCNYIKNGEATLNELLLVVCIYCLIAFVIGVYLTLTCGWGVALLAIIGGGIVLTYAKLSSSGLSELAVGTAFGPLLFEGVYYVMCQKFSLTVLLISLCIVSFTVGLVYMNNLLDYDSDVASGKKSLAIRLGGKDRATLGLLVIYLVGYIFAIILALYSKNLMFLMPVITCPLAFAVYKSINEYYQNNTKVPKIRWWNYPIGNLEELIQNGTANFYVRLYLARNIMIWVSLFMLTAISLY
jgi:1,4-dihydroxy-2-naphthoate octaprenyltransferase